MKNTSSLIEVAHDLHESSKLDTIMDECGNKKSYYYTSKK